MHGALEYVWLSVTLVVLMANGILNGTVLTAVCCNKSLIQRRYGILISLAVADILKIAPMFAQIVTIFVGPEKRTAVLACMIVSSTGLLLIGITILHLVFESINRLILITRPLRYENLLTPKRFGVILALVWLIPIIGITLPHAIFKKPYMWHHSLRVIMFSCDVIDHADEEHLSLIDSLSDSFLIYAVVITVVYFAVPLVTMAISYSIIFKVSLKHIRQLAKLEVKMRQLHHRYSNRQLSSAFGSQFAISNASSVATVDSAVISQQPVLFSRKKRNSIVPSTSATSEGNVGRRISMCDFDAVHGRPAPSSASIVHTGRGSETRQVLQLLEFARREAHEDDNCKIVNKARNSKDSGHGTSSQTSNIAPDPLNPFDEDSRHGIFDYSTMIGQAAKNETTNDKHPLYAREDSNWSEVLQIEDVNASDTDTHSLGCREDNFSVINNNNKESDDANISTTDLYNLLAGFSVMGAYAESLRAKSAAPQNSFSRFQAVIKEELRNRKKEIKLVRTLGGLIAAWILFYLPILIYSWEKLILSPLDSAANSDLGRLLLSWALFNSALNPIIYCLRIAEFKNAVKKILRNIKQFFRNG